MSDPDWYGLHVDNKLGSDVRVLHEQRLRDLIRAERASHRPLDVANKVAETNSATRAAAQYRVATSKMIRVGLAQEHRQDVEWRREEARARAVNRAAERAALEDMRQAMREMYVLHKAGRLHELQEKEKELKQHLEEANAARESRRSLYSASARHSNGGVPKSLRELRITRSMRHEQSDQADVLCGERYPLFDAIPDVDEFDENKACESIQQRISHLQSFRDQDPPSFTQPHALPQALVRITQQAAESTSSQLSIETKSAENDEKEPPVSTKLTSPDILTITHNLEPQRCNSNLFPSVISPRTSPSASIVSHPKPFTTTTYQIDRNAKAAAMYRTKLPIFTQTEGDEMLQQVCLFTVNQSRDEHEAREMEQRENEERDRSIKAQWVMEEQQRQREKLLAASTSGLVDLQTDPLYSMLLAYAVLPTANAPSPELSKTKVVEDEPRPMSVPSPSFSEQDESNDEISSFRPRPTSPSSDSQSAVQFSRPLSSSGRPQSATRPRTMSSQSAAGTAHSRPTTQSTRLFPAAQMKSRWQHAAGRSTSEQLTRRMNRTKANNASRPDTAAGPSSEHSDFNSSIALAYSADPLHSTFLREQRVHRARATAAVFDTVKTWLEQQEETRKRRVNWEASQSNGTASKPHTFSLDDSSPFQALLTSESKLSPRTLKRQSANLSRAPLSSSNSAVFIWLKKHAIVPARTVKPIEEIRYRSVFAELDTDESGMLDENELLTAMQSTHSLNISQEELRSLLNSMDLTGRYDGKLSFTQFVNQFASIDEWESLFKLWRRRREERSKHQNQTAPLRSARLSQSDSASPQRSSRQLQSAKLDEDAGSCLVPFLLWVPAYHRLRLLDSLIACQLTSEEESILKQQAVYDSHVVQQNGNDRPQSSTSLSLLDLWRVTRTQVKRKRIEADAADQLQMQNLQHMHQEMQKRGKVTPASRSKPSHATSSEHLQQVMQQLKLNRANRLTGHQFDREHLADDAFTLFKQAVEGNVSET